MLIILILVEFCWLRVEGLILLRFVGCFLMHCNQILMSTRQKQYFEQRRRQQQNVQMKGFDTNAEGSDMQIHKEHQSLDILNLLNLSKNAQECSYVGHKGKCLIFFLHSRVTYIDQLSIPNPTIVLFGLYMKHGLALASGGLFAGDSCIIYHPNQLRIGFVCLQKRDGFVSWDFRENKSCLHCTIHSLSFSWFSCFTN